VGAGVHTVIDTEILSCPRCNVLPQVAAWVRASNEGAGEASYSEKLHLSPVVVEAARIIADVHRRVAEARAERNKPKADDPAMVMRRG
jgi:hypothetical protein